MAQTVWFVCIDPADKGKSASFLETVDFRIPEMVGSFDYNTLQHGGVINWNGQPLTKWKGPFATEAEAKAAQAPKQQSPNPATDLKNAAGNSNLLNFGLHGSGFAGWFFRGLKIVFGGILMILGISQMLGVENKVTQLAGQAGKLAIFA